MRSNMKIRSAQVTADVALVTTTETVVATLGNVTNQAPDGVIRFLGYASVQGGTNNTFVTLRVRRGTGITGTVVGEADPATLTGAAIAGVPIMCEDAPGEVGGVPYVLTVQLTGATANGSVPFGSLVAIS